MFQRNQRRTIKQSDTIDITTNTIKTTYINNNQKKV